MDVSHGTQRAGEGHTDPDQTSSAPGVAERETCAVRGEAEPRARHAVM